MAHQKGKEYENGGLPKRTSEGRLLVNNPDGSFSTERTETVEINGQFFNVPTLFNGESVPIDQAINIIKKNQFVDPDTGRVLQGFNDVNEAVTSAKSRSQQLGQQLGISQLVPQVKPHRVADFDKRLNTDLEGKQTPEQLLNQFNETKSQPANVQDKARRQFKFADGGIGGESLDDLLRLFKETSQASPIGSGKNLQPLLSATDDIVEKGAKELIEEGIQAAEKKGINEGLRQSTKALANEGGTPVGKVIDKSNVLQKGGDLVVRSNTIPDVVETTGRAIVKSGGTTPAVQGSKALVKTGAKKAGKAALSTALKTVAKAAGLPIAVAAEILTASQAGVENEADLVDQVPFGADDPSLTQEQRDQLEADFLNASSQDEGQEQRDIQGGSNIVDSLSSGLPPESNQSLGTPNDVSIPEEQVAETAQPVVAPAADQRVTEQQAKVNRLEQLIANFKKGQPQRESDIRRARLIDTGSDIAQALARFGAQRGASKATAASFSPVKSTPLQFKGSGVEASEIAKQAREKAAAGSEFTKQLQIEKLDLAKIKILADKGSSTLNNLTSPETIALQDELISAGFEESKARGLTGQTISKNLNALLKSNTASESRVIRRENKLDKDVKDLEKNVRPIKVSQTDVKNLEQIIGFDIDTYDAKTGTAEFKDSNGKITRKTPNLPGGVFPGIGRITATTSTGRDFNSSLKAIFNKELKERSGAAVTDPELNRLEQEFSTGKFDTDENLIKALKRYKNRLRQIENSATARAEDEVLTETERRIGQTLFTKRKRTDSPDKFDLDTEARILKVQSANPSASRDDIIKALKKAGKI